VIARKVRDECASTSTQNCRREFALVVGDENKSRLPHPRSECDHLAFHLRRKRVQRRDAARSRRRTIAIGTGARSDGSTRFSSKYFLLLSSNCAMLLKIFSQRVGTSCEVGKIARKNGMFVSLGAPGDSGFAAGLVLSVESPVAKHGRCCACFFNL